MRSLLYAADLLAMPSLFEGLPISLLEAQACGLPALLADTPGLREFRDWFPGLVYCEPNAKDVARALKSFAEMPVSERCAQSSQWSEKAEQTFGVGEGVRRYLSVYDAMLHG